jgi:hypothetical protein
MTPECCGQKMVIAFHPIKDGFTIYILCPKCHKKKYLNVYFWDFDQFESGLLGGCIK